MAHIETDKWSGEGAFTELLLDRLQAFPAITAIRVEDAPASRADADYNFISNEIFVAFAVTLRREPSKRFGFLPASRTVGVKAMTLPELDAALAASPDVGAPDYSDEGMLQYLRTERIIPHYQTKGYKLVELVRLYEIGTPSRAGS